MIAAARTLLVALLLLPGTAHAARVAVLEFANLSGDAAWDPLGKGLQELFVVDLDKADAIEVIPRRDLREQATALGVGTPAPLDQRKRLAGQIGASHVISGSFTVRGPKLALELEILDAAAGRVVLTDRRDGDSEAFFELQKEALQASIRALDLSLTPRERAETGRLHTADFLAFQDFSRGLDLFDAERYEASLTALRSATERDAEFSLARLTLEAYERLIADTRAKASAIHAVKIEERRLARFQAAGEEVEVVRRLLEVARREGAANQRLRLTAVHTLAVAYGGPTRRGYQLRNLREVEDRFALARAGDRMWAQYQAEALPLWPKLPVQPDEDFFEGLPKLATFDADLEKAAKRLWEHGADYPENRKNYLINNLRYPRYSAAKLHLSLADEVRMHDRHLELAIAHGAPDWWLKSEREELVKAYRRVLRYDDSTRILEQFAKASDNEWALKGFASEMETNRDAVALLESGMPRALAEEWLIHGWSPDNASSERYLRGGQPTPELLAWLTRERRFPANDGFVLLDEIPLWSLNPGYGPRLGPMTDARRTTALRYHQDDDDDLAALIVAGAEPIADLTLATTLRYTVPADFWPGSATPGREDRGVASGRPTVGVLFGLTDIDVPLQKNAAAEQSADQRAPGAVVEDKILARPMTGYALWITGDEVQLARVVEAKRGSYDRKEALAVEVLARAPLKRGADTLPVSLTVRGAEATASVGSVRLRARLPEPAFGFQGFWMVGAGFVEVDGLTVKGDPGR
jgi:TolB-like protein